MNRSKPLAGLVLCGGKSRRMGRDKALLEVGGVPLVVLVARRLSAVADLGIAERPEPGAGGPLAGLVAGLASSLHGLVAVVAVDMPEASASLFRLLAAQHQGEDAVVPVDEGGRQPLHAVFSRDAHEPLSTALHEGTRGVLDALSRLRVREVGEREWRTADPSGRFATNLNAPEDLLGGRGGGDRIG